MQNGARRTLITRILARNNLPIFKGRTMVAPSITESQLQTALRSALLAILPAGTEVIEGQDSNVPEPQGVDFVVMTPIARERLDTNLIAYADCAFTGSASGTTLTVTAVHFGSIANGAPLYWPTLPYSGPTIAFQAGSGSGGVGQYTLSAPVNMASGPMAAGQCIVTQPTKVTVQLDFHSANVGDSSDMAAAVTTLFRSEQATTASLFNSGSTGVWPLYADDAKQVPFQNAEQQYETMWTLDTCLQINQAINWPQQFATALQVRFFQADT
jgi:hypothetical protein